ncbi:zinc finger C2HC domain-containing 1A [Pelobates cultripes]|uniref:Zinc finger C2HC domain-containing protein 1A n=1 Tax=Pelobates cultripes TaxID=61616 RepID=A0AAD1W3L3_PELCU|nr:zinc finger C2HC domain-containing 1A [Pelobates cultripes]CAH2285457.1 zinc finger C2HC domain-containing 1A [Pelobates cultripes]
MEELEENLSSEELRPCKICGRTFFPGTLKKHILICQKASTKKRRTFDSSRQRAEGTDITTVKPVKQRPEPPKKPSNWRRKHEEFIATIRAARGINLKDGGELPPPPPPSYDPDYIQCPYCQRRFSENAADRHISFCKEQAARITNKGKLVADTKVKNLPRPQLKPPSIKKTNSPASVSNTTTRLPQPPNFGKSASGIPSGKSSAGTGTATPNKYQSFSPAHKNASPQVGGTAKSRTPPSLAKNPTTDTSMNRRKTYNAENYSRPDNKSGYTAGENTSTVNGNRMRGVDNSTLGQQTKFCHECGTKYPVQWAKFCCECGVKRMAL